MTQRGRLVALARIAALRRDMALQQLALARAGEEKLQGQLVAVDLARSEARAAVAGADPATARHIDQHLRWLALRRCALRRDLAEAAQSAAACREAASQALGRTSVLEGLCERLAANAEVLRLRRQ